MSNHKGTYFNSVPPEVEDRNNEYSTENTVNAVPQISGDFVESISETISESSNNKCEMLIEDNKKIDDFNKVKRFKSGDTTENTNISTTLDYEDSIIINSGEKRDISENLDATETHKTNLDDLTAGFNSNDKINVEKNISSKNQVIPYYPSLYLGAYHCDICEVNLPPNSWRIQCQDCSFRSNDVFDLCIDCFARGAELPAKTGPNNETIFGHYNTHQYIVISANTFPLFHTDWTADEEIYLLEAISKLGYGNWQEVAFFINQVTDQNKTQEDCEQHYNEYYLNNKTAPLPDLSRCLDPIVSKNQISINENLNIINPETPTTTYFQNSRNSEYQPPKLQKQKSQTPLRGNKSVIGFWPLRGDFDIEHENDAELLIADMEYNESDTPQEKLLKLQVIEIYNSKLDERNYRKQLVIER